MIKLSLHRQSITGVDENVKQRLKKIRDCGIARLISFLADYRLSAGCKITLSAICHVPLHETKCARRKTIDGQSGWVTSWHLSID